MRRNALLAMMICLAVTAAPMGAQTPAPLPLGAPQQGTATSAAPAEYTIAAKTAGVLTVAVQGTGDLVIQVVDGDGQTLPEGTSDRDLNGNEGTELASVTLNEPGAYRVRVRSQGNSGSSTFQIAASFLGFPPFQRPGDPDGRPVNAKEVQVGKAYEDTLDPSAGDNWDWFVFTPVEAGTLTVVTRQSGTGDAPDLVLELYTGGSFSNATERSDQDLQNNTANESVSLTVTAGQKVHAKVLHAFGSRSASYRLSSSLAP